jgi:hypothetical protein
LSRSVFSAARAEFFLFLFPRLRFLASYFLLGPIGAVAGLVTFILLASRVTFFLDDPNPGGGSLILMVLAFMMGAALGALAGLWLAYMINRRMGWTHPDLVAWAKKYLSPA